jgi:PAN domain
MATNDIDRKGPSRAWIAWLVLLVIVGWQLYLGVTIQEVGIPGVFSVKFGTRPHPPAGMSATEDGYDRHGSDYKDFVATDIGQCLSECAADARCKAIAFNKSSNQCWMKNAYAERRQNSAFISAVKVGD